MDGHHVFKDDRPILAKYSNSTGHAGVDACYHLAALFGLFPFGHGFRHDFRALFGRALEDRFANRLLHDCLFSFTHCPTPS